MIVNYITSRLTMKVLADARTFMRKVRLSINTPMIPVLDAEARKMVSKQLDCGHAIERGELKRIEDVLRARFVGRPDAVGSLFAPFRGGAP